MRRTGALLRTGRRSVRPVLAAADGRLEGRASLRHCRARRRVPIDPARSARGARNSAAQWNHRAFYISISIVSARCSTFRARMVAHVRSTVVGRVPGRNESDAGEGCHGRTKNKRSFLRGRVTNGPQLRAFTCAFERIAPFSRGGAAKTKSLVFCEWRSSRTTEEAHCIARSAPRARTGNTRQLVTRYKR